MRETVTPAICSPSNICRTFICFQTDALSNLDVELPPSPVAAHWVSDVADSGHLPVELWHWAVLLDLLSESALCPEGLVRSHLREKAQPKPLAFWEFFG